jgi:hypothetical protein
MRVKIQKDEIQDNLKYHFKDDSVNIQRVRAPNTNNKIGNAIFILLILLGLLVGVFECEPWRDIVNVFHFHTLTGAFM